MLKNKEGQKKGSDNPGPSIIPHSLRPLFFLNLYQVIEDPGDLEGWSEIEAADKETILALIRESNEARETKSTPKKGYLWKRKNKNKNRTTRLIF